ncbi:hypothetical protein TRAPUB_11177 [Trametes pubescens]|uniref:Uncharacterized protein n=1 Tax=Trametes pubescens TaxID=154538 RepID=A0A1M2VXK7_TRAPU|nr:hypothetical protein TRAPUB_11177 [Trametes pubescens]
MTNIGNNAKNTSDSGANNGIGESIRGRPMAAVDSSDTTHPEVEEGGREIEHGMARLTGGPGVENARITPVFAETRTDPLSDGPQTTAAPHSHRGNILGPASGVATGLHPGPESAVANGPQCSSPGAADDAAAFQGGRNDRDFHPGSADRVQEGGPAPDRNALSRSPQRLA